MLEPEARRPGKGGTQMSKKKSTKPEARPAKEPKPNKEKAPKQDLVVFAFRLPATDRDLIHRAAGPAKATKFVHAAALAAASGDTRAFEDLTAQAKANLK